MKTEEIIEMLISWSNDCHVWFDFDGHKANAAILLREAAHKLRKNAVQEHEIEVLKKLIGELRKELAEREAAPGWISVEERMPEESGYYLAYDCRGNLFICLYQANGLWDSSSVDYWMLLPEPPKPKAKTYKDVFFDSFPDGDMDAVQSRLCINIFFPLFDRPERCVDCEDCWNQPYPEEEGGEE